MNLSLRRSITIFGTMRPTLIAGMMATAVGPSAIVAVMSGKVVFGPVASWTRPLAILKIEKRPGSSSHTSSSQFESLRRQAFRLLFPRRGNMRHDHLCRIDHAIKLFFSDEAEFQ